MADHVDDVLAQWHAERPDLDVSLVTSGAITQRLDRLEERGLVSRAPSASDRRGVEVTLTDDGRALIDRALPDHVLNEHRLLEGLEPGQRQALADALSRLIGSIGDAGT